MTLIKILIVAVLLLKAGSLSAETFGSATDTTGLGFVGFGWTLCRMNAHATLVHVASAGDVVTGFSVFAETVDGGDNDTISVALYNITSGVGGAPIEGSAVKIPVTAPAANGDWHTVSGLSISLTADSTYALAIGSEVGAVACQRTADGSLTGGRSLHAVATLAATWTESSSGNRYYALYATYTPGSAAAGQVIMIQ